MVETTMTIGTFAGRYTITANATIGTYATGNRLAEFVFRLPPK